MERYFITSPPHKNAKNHLLVSSASTACGKLVGEDWKIMGRVFVARQISCTACRGEYALLLPPPARPSE